MSVSNGCQSFYQQSVQRNEAKEEVMKTYKNTSST